MRCPSLCQKSAKWNEIEAETGLAQLSLAVSAAAMRRDEIAPATSFKTAAAIGEAQIEIGLFPNHDEVAQVVRDAGGREREEDNLGWMDG